MRIFGQHFTPDIIDFICSQLSQTPGMSRRELSRCVCERLDWRTTNGQWQEGSCRKALLRLHQLNKIDLPDAVNPFENVHSARAMDVPRVHFKGELVELGQVELLPVGDRRSQLARLWKAMLEEHHYLGNGPLCGAQIKYVIQSETLGYIGALAFSSASWALQARDHFIGWSDEARQAQLNRVITNSRFLLMPDIDVDNLASHVLSKSLKRVAGDWRNKYDIEPVLVETFVDCSRYTGCSYRAANWQCVGQSTGRRDGQRKDIYLYPLCTQWKEILCQPPVVGLSAAPEQKEAGCWTEEEFGRLRVYDKRLKQRLCTLAADFFNRPQANIPEACGSKAKTMGAYRFFQNKKMSMDVILTPHIESTINRIREHSVVLAPQDTSTLNYVTHPGTQGFGPTNNLDDHSVGLILHDTVAFTEQGTPLGVIDAQCWARDAEEQGKSRQRKQLPIEEKESFKWIKSFQKLREIQALCPQTQLISIGDRESDLYELFAEATQSENDPKLLVRSERSRQRKVENAYLWDQMEQRAPDGAIKIQLPKRGNQPSRTATLQLHYAHVALTPPKSKRLDPITLSAVYLVEIDPDPEVLPIEWMLLTTTNINNLEQAKKCVEWYSGRWGIEVYHRTLKSGCRIKERQLGTADRIQTCLGVDMVIAWRVLYLTMLGREVPEQPCTVFFEDIEWKALHCYHYKVSTPPEQPPLLADAIKMVGKVGGHLGRKQDGAPGAECIWRGLQRLDAAVDMYAIMRNEELPSIRSSYPHALTCPRDGP